MTIIAFITGFFTFFNEVVALIKLLQRTPAEKRQDAVAAVHAAVSKSNQTRGDTSDEEALFNP
jgi:hypothetical protein